MHQRLDKMARNRDDRKTLKWNQLLGFLILLGIAQVHAQVVEIPDSNFLHALIGHGVDTNQDGKIQYKEAQRIKRLDISFSEIKDLTGIHSFDSLSSFNCMGNQITALDLSQMGALNTVVCSHNHLVTLDVGGDTGLVTLECEYNQLLSLDISSNRALFYFSSIDNPNLVQICISDSQSTNLASTWNGYIDSTTTWNTFCFPTDIQDQALQKATPILLHVYTLFGQEVPREAPVPGLYIFKYSDGTSKKVLLGY
jgi:Leucine-rich repeat (LRR) protein